MSELSAGGLALIIAGRFPENVGKTVRLNRFVGQLDDDGDHFWELTALTELTGTICTVRVGDSCFGRAKNLMPIDGDSFTHEDERRKELVNG